MYVTPIIFNLLMFELPYLNNITSGYHLSIFLIINYSKSLQSLSPSYLVFFVRNHIFYGCMNYDFIKIKFCSQREIESLYFAILWLLARHWCKHFVEPQCYFVYFWYLHISHNHINKIIDNQSIDIE